ncbi:MAG TPA: HAD family hydrolase [Terriglobales bacterium]|nr:HAD family hydrolase [Terriglobales bacterium]
MTPFVWDSADAYLFDIDGTLLNTRDGVHYHAFHHAVRDVFGVDSSIDGVPVHGNTDIGILRAVLERGGISAEVIAERLPLALRHMCDEVQQNAAGIRPELCPSIADLLRRLQAAGKLMGIVSGNLEPIGWAKLSAAGLRDYFSFGSFSDRHERRADIFRHGIAEARQRLGPNARVCVVGDTPRDIEAAREVGIPVIAVATGIFTRDDLLAHRPDLCVSCCTDLLGGR